jgi:hypothetical protein
VPFQNATEVFDGFARPKGATPTIVTLVPAYDECTGSSGMNHGAPLAVPSCTPAQSSDYLTVGSPDANGKPALSSGRVQLKAVGESPIDLNNGNQADVQVIASLTDVRKKSDLSDYTGELSLVMGVRATDKNNGTAQYDASGTASDSTIAVNMSCSATGADEGGTCNAATTVNAVTGGNLALEGKRAVWDLSQIQVYDGGSDGDADTTGDNTLFQVQGLFAP